MEEEEEEDVVVVVVVVVVYVNRLLYNNIEVERTTNKEEVRLHCQHRAKTTFFRYPAKSEPCLMDGYGSAVVSHIRLLYVTSS